MVHKNMLLMTLKGPCRKQQLATLFGFSFAKFSQKKEEEEGYKIGKLILKIKVRNRTVDSKWSTQ